MTLSSEMPEMATGSPAFMPAVRMALSASTPPNVTCRTAKPLAVAQAEERRAAQLVREGIMAAGRAEAALAVRRQAETDVR
ncbi:MAG: hypothetical protein RLZ59_102, partial [Pseudomonadota bacterium]